MKPLPRILCRLILAGIGCTLVPAGTAGAQQGDDLSRLIGLYRTGNAEQAASGLQALLRVAESFAQRAVLEYHLGLALLKVRPADGSAALRRSIALDPDLRPDAAASIDERTAWNAARARMRIPASIRFEPAAAIPGTGDSLGFVVDIPLANGIAPPPARVLLAVSPGRDPIELWNGTAGETGKWDGMFGGEPPKTGVYPLIVEVFDEAGAAPLRWRRMLAVTADAVTQPLPLAPRPSVGRATASIRVDNPDGRKRAQRRGIIWGVGGGLVSFVASRMVPNVIGMSPPNGAPRVALASVYGAGLASALYGTTKVVLSGARRYETTVVLPDEGAMTRRRIAEAAWHADSIRIMAINARRESLRRITVDVRERR